MTNEHPNFSLLARFWQGLSEGDPSKVAEVVADDFVWHFFNPTLPDLEGDYRGTGGIFSFFEKLQASSDNTFEIKRVSATPIGDELLVAHMRPTLSIEGVAVETDAVVVFRFRENRILEVWDIPAVYAGRPPTDDG
jgi:ketosteroid isomerase-like protein